MNYELFIARKILNGTGSDEANQSGTQAILKFSIFGVALGVALMVLSIAVVTGFQKEIQSKVVGFGSHIQITEFNYEDPLHFKAIEKKQPFYEQVKNDPDIRSIQTYALKEGIIKTKDNISGVIAKGIDIDFNWTFFRKNLEEGTLFTVKDSAKSNAVIISRDIAKTMDLTIGDPLLIIFIHNGKSRPRKFTIQGIYNTGMQQFDKAYVLIDIKHIQRINGWSKNQVSGFEILLHDYADLFRINEILYNKIPHELNTTTINQQYPEIFGWLELQDMNVVVIIVLLTLVSGITMITALLILILEKTNMIGILKASGARNGNIRKIFLYTASSLVLRGLFWGNLIGLSVAFLQLKFNLIALDEASYYIDHVPINIEFMHVLILNVTTFILCMLMLIIPAAIISNISPSKSIKFN